MSAILGLPDQLYAAIAVMPRPKGLRFFNEGWGDAQRCEKAQKVSRVHACLHPARDLSCALRAYERHLTTRAAAWQVLVYGIIEHLDGTIMRQEKEIEDRDFLAAKTMALLGLLGRTRLGAPRPHIPRVGGRRGHVGVVRVCPDRCESSG